MNSRSLATLPLPSSTLSALTRAGYETVQDLQSCTPEALALELHLPLDEVSHAVALAQKRKPTAIPVPLTQTVTTLVHGSVEPKISTLCPPLDNLLGGGLSRGAVLELSGPPGSPKEVAAISIVKSVVKEGNHVIFVDFQNMTSPSRLREACGPIADDAIYYLRICTVSDLMIFMRTLETHLGVHPQVALLVLNSLSFPFQTPKLSMQARKSLLDQIKQCIAKSCATHTLSVISTMQLSTKLIGADGKPSNFDDKDARGILAPQLGPGYLPTTRSYRVRFSHSGTRTGIITLLSSPFQPDQRARKELPYELVSQFEIGTPTDGEVS